LEKRSTHEIPPRCNSRILTVALVGYTNAGKSTLLNLLARSDVCGINSATLAQPHAAFAWQPPLFTDTVGLFKTSHRFIVHFTPRWEPRQLLHIVDISHPNASIVWIISMP
jgi:GTP-binding protein HflX